MQERRIASPDEMFDLLATMPDGKFATICYVNAVQLYKTKKAVNMDQFGADLDSNQPEGDDPVYNQLRQYHDDDKVKKLPLACVVSVTRYNLNWASEERHNQHYAEFAAKKDEIDKRYGIYKEPEERRQGGFDAVNTFGASLGTTDNTRNRAYIHQNTAKARMKSDLYAVDAEGNITGTVNPAYIKSLRQPKTDSAVNALRKLEKSEEEIAQYQQEIAALNFTHRKFLIDKILYIIATIGDDKFVYINESLSRNIDVKSKAVIDTSQFINLANQLFRQDDSMTESLSRNYKMIKEYVEQQIMANGNNKNLSESVQKTLIETVVRKALLEFTEEDQDYGYSDWEDFDEEQEEDINPVMEYEQGYPNGNFDPSTMDQYDLAKWCRNCGDFLYIYQFPLGGMKASAANTEGIQSEIIADIYNCSHIEATHEVDYLLNPRSVDFEGCYVAVYKLCGVKGDNGDYYIVYETPKD